MSAIENYRDNEMEGAIDRAVDTVYPVFRMFGWTYWSSLHLLNASRTEIEDLLRSHTDHVLKDIATKTEDVVSTSISSGRLKVEAHMEDGTLTVGYFLELAEGYGD